MKKSLRIGYNRYYDEKIFEEHLNYIKEYSDVIDEITLFAEFSHYGYQTLEFCEKNAVLLADRIDRYKKIGIKSVGINILTTIGHLEEGWSVLPRAELQYAVNENGELSKSCLCPGNEEFLEYISKKYALYAATGTDFIWYDDDVRAHNHGVAQNGCFCEKCVDKFNKKYSTCFNRNSLAASIRDDEDTKKRWEEFQTEILRTLIKTICNAVRGVSPEIKIGAMTTGGNSGNEFGNLKPDLCRPGGSFYNDDTPADVLGKYFEVQKQVLSYPSEIDDIQYEYEAFNYQNLDKSMRITEIETVLAIMSGCNGVLYNNDIFNDRTDITELFRKRAEMWDILSEKRKDAVLCGVYCDDVRLSRLVNEIGIPVTADKENAKVALFTGERLAAMSTGEIEALLEMSLFTDGEGVRALCEKDFEECCGGKVKAVYECGMAERFSENELNGNFKNYYRDVFMNFFDEGLAYEFEISKDARILANAETITHIKKGCAMYIYDDKLAADGYFMPKSLLSSAKQEQLYNVLDRLSAFSLPVKIKKSLRVAPIAAKSADGKMLVTLLNLSLDETGAFELEIRGGGTFCKLEKNGEIVPLRQTNTGDNVIVNIDNIAGVDYIVLINDK